MYSVLLNLVDSGGLTIEDVSSPRVMFAVVIEARRLMDPWDPHLDARIAEVTSRVPERLRRLDHRIRADRRLSWWHDSVTAVDQVVVSDAIGEGGDDLDGRTATYESYAQRPARSLLTSSLREGTSVLHEVIREHVGDLDPSPRIGWLGVA
jgi:hypothetical protein